MRRKSLQLLAAASLMTGSLLFTACGSSEPGVSDKAETTNKTETTKVPDENTRLPGIFTDGKKEDNQENKENNTNPVPSDSNENKDDEQMVKNEGTVVTEVAARYIRYHSLVEIPKNTVSCVTSEEDLKKYYDAMTSWADFRGSFGGDSLTDGLKEYDEAFFVDKDLIIVNITEGSGSVSHKVFGIEYGTDAETGKRSLTPVIKRNVPEIATDDMAYRQILIAVDKAYKSAECRLNLPADFPGVEAADRVNK